MKSSITCPKCQRTSYNANDIQQGYCGHCHDWTSQSFPVPQVVCPTCNYNMDRTTVVTPGEPCPPTPGDFTLCLKCGEILCFTQTLHVRPAELNDLLDATPDALDLLERAQRMIRTLPPLK